MRHSTLLLLAMVCNYALDSFAFAGIPRYPVGRLEQDILLSGWGPDILLAGWGHDIPLADWGPDILLSVWGPDNLLSGWGPYILLAGWGQDILLAGWGLDLRFLLLLHHLFYKEMMHCYVLLPIIFNFQ